jgi:uncharacterized coiled-coil protein SlyX
MSSLPIVQILQRSRSASHVTTSARILLFHSAIAVVTTTTVGSGGRIVLILEQRMAHLEGRVVEQSNTFEAIRDVNASLVREMQLLNAAGDRIEQRFAWMFGLQATTFVAIVVALFGR